MDKKIILMSDLHLDFSNVSVIDFDYDILVLAGDIATDFFLFEDFISKLNKNKKVVFVPGNHEYENKLFDEVVPRLKKIQLKYPYLNVLQNEFCVIDNYKFIGTTLWTNFEGGGIENKNKVKDWARKNVVDFKSIYKKDNMKELGVFRFTPEEMEEEFKKSIMFIESELYKKDNYKKIIVTHFAPHINSISEEYKKNINSFYWVNNLKDFMGYSDFWLHGHTHNSFDYNINGTRVLCNPRGVSKIFDISENIEFKKNFYLY